MGAGASSNGGVLEKHLRSLEPECKKPEDASDVQDFDECKKELIELRKKIRTALSDSMSLMKTEDDLLRDCISELLGKAMEVEKTITPFLKNVAKECNGTLVGLNHRFKGRESLERKIRGDIDVMKRSMSRGVETASVDIRSVVQNIGDSLRYTMLIPDKEYCQVVLNTRKVLEEMGNVGKKFKNYWEKGDMYQGINDLYLNKSCNFVFELQFHTEASWDLKSQSHIIYEKFRVCKDPMEQQKLFQEGVELAMSLAIPEGVEDIPHLTRNPEPNILESYSHLIHEHGVKCKEALTKWFASTCDLATSIQVEVDDERTVESELSALVDAHNKSVEKVVLEDYYFGVMVKIILKEETYVQQMQKLLEKAKAEDAVASSESVQCRQVVNHWVNNQGGPCVRILACLGSRASPYPADNLLFEVVLHTAQSAEAEEDANLLMRMQLSQSTKDSGMKEKVEKLRSGCKKPAGIEEIASSQ